MTTSGPLTMAEEATETVKIIRAEVRQAEADTQVAEADLVVAAPPVAGKKSILFLFFAKAYLLRNLNHESFSLVSNFARTAESIAEPIKSHRMFF